MIDRETAIRIVEEYWNKDVTRAGNEFCPSSVALTEDGDFFVIYGNSKAFVEDRDFMRNFVGISAFIVDSFDGTLTISGSAQDPQNTLQDCRDDKVAAGKHYVLAAGTGKKGMDENTALRSVFQCGIADAKRILSEPDRFWFVGKKRMLLAYQREFESLGLPTEIVLLDSHYNSIEIGWRGRFSWDLSHLKSQLGVQQ